MQVNRGEALLDLTEEPLEPVDFQVRMQATLHKDPGAADFHCLANLFKDGVEIEDVALSRQLTLQRTIERAEGAVLSAEVGVINVAVNDVGDYVLGVELAAQRVGFHADTDEVVGPEHLYGL